MLGLIGVGYTMASTMQWGGQITGSAGGKERGGAATTWNSLERMGAAEWITYRTRKLWGRLCHHHKNTLMRLLRALRHTGQFCRTCSEEGGIAGLRCHLSIAIECGINNQLERCWPVHPAFPRMQTALPRMHTGSTRLQPSAPVQSARTPRTPGGRTVR